MNRILTFLSLLLIFHIASPAKTNPFKDRLEKELGNRQLYLERKVASIDSLNAVLQHCTDIDRKFKVFERLFSEQITFRADSALNCSTREMQFAEKEGDYNDISRAKIHKSMALATMGLFSQAEQLMKSIQSSKLKNDLKGEYFSSLSWLYDVWSDYAGKNAYSNDFKLKSINYMDSSVNNTSPKTPIGKYLRGEKFLKLKQYDKALPYYLEVEKTVPVNNRLYAQATYAAAIIYENKKQWDKYEEYLYKAAISDQVIPLKENLALQQLALYTKTKYGDLKKANEYLKYSLEDAIFYDNRLRLLEIAHKYPDIILAYHKELGEKNSRLNSSLIVIALLTLGLVIILFIMYKMWTKSHQKAEVLKVSNDKLESITQQLIDVNRMREEYVSLFMDLCATYINKLNLFRAVVKAKVKARQYDELLKPSFGRTSEAESRELFFNFDKAFLKLFPDFVEKFNDLLREDERIVLRRNEQLNTELRIFAMIRMGITDSSKIATLLFYSPQTIYNYRSSMRNRAKNKDTFDSDVQKLCPLV